jgi:uncharacterized protein (TIGR02996 family)
VEDPPELIAAILAAPDDDAPRLVLADWLMARSDPRGELIAVQCALATAGPQDLERRAREAQLIAACEAGSLAPILKLLTTWHWRRGFLHSVSAILPGFLDAFELLRTMPLEHITIHGYRPRLGARFAALTHPTVRHVGLPRNRLAGALEVLDARLIRNAESLSLWGNPLGTDGLIALAGGEQPRLRELDLGRCAVTGEGLAALATTPWWSRLTTLNLHENQLADAAMSSIARATGLRRLDLRGNPISDRGALRLAGAGMSRLEELTIGETRISERSVEPLLAGLPALRELLAWDVLSPEVLVRIRARLEARARART